MAAKKSTRRFATMSQADVPHGRNGKHKGIVSSVIADLEGLQDGLALKVALADLDDSKENVRSALNRATRKLNRNVATAADAEFLYVWNVAD